jgi:redox-sensing transcriptional repressor
MSDVARAPEASMLRLSRYHCFLGDVLRTGEALRVTSHEIADELGMSEESVRRDLSYIDIEGRPGSGYDPATLYDALESYLGLTDAYPFVAIGDLDMLRALAVVFPAATFGLEAGAYFSPRTKDVGHDVEGVPVHALDELPTIAREIPASVALVACEPESVQDALRLLDQEGIRAVLMLTPVLRPRHPAGMEVTYFRIPCALKALASIGPKAAPRCDPSETGVHGCCHG